MNIKGPMYLDLGTNEKAGVALVGLSRTNLFTNIILKDIDKFKFQKYVTTGQRIKKHLKEIRFKEKRTLRDLNII